MTTQIVPRRLRRRSRRKARSLCSRRSTEPYPRQSDHFTRGYVTTTIALSRCNDHWHDMSGTRYDARGPVLHLAIPRRTSNFKPNLASTRSRPVDQHVPGLATRTRRLSRPHATAHELPYELACAPTLSPHTRASSTRLKGNNCTPSHMRLLLVSTTYIITIKTTFDAHASDTKITCYNYLPPCLSSLHNLLLTKSDQRRHLGDKCIGRVGKTYTATAVDHTPVCQKCIDKNKIINVQLEQI
jgi:hypothetical protein